MKYDDLTPQNQINMQVLCAKALLASFQFYLDAGKFDQMKQQEKNALWRNYEQVKVQQDKICHAHTILAFVFEPKNNTETRAEKHHRLRVAINMENAKRGYMLSVLGIEATPSRTDDWAKIGKRLADKHHFLTPTEKNPGRPKATGDINLARANAFDAMKAFLLIGQGKEGLPLGVELEYPPTEAIPSSLRISDKLILKIYYKMQEFDFYDDVKYCLSIVEETLQLLGAKNEASLINSISRGRTQRRNESSFSLVKNHNQIFNKK